MANLYKHKDSAPFHISVGAVLVNDEGKICVHKHTPVTTPEHLQHLIGGLACAYILMRESLEDGETIEEGVRRGLREEFGAESDILRYLGSIQATIRDTELPWEKTTLYFQAKLENLGTRPPDDGEAHSVLEWHEPQFLLERMREQGQRTDREDLDESKIIEAYMKYGNS